MEVNIAVTPDADSIAGDSPEDMMRCTPQCDRRACGDDGCGGECGRCAAGERCREADQARGEDLGESLCVPDVEERSRDAGPPAQNPDAESACEQTCEVSGDECGERCGDGGTVCTIGSTLHTSSAAQLRRAGEHGGLCGGRHPSESHITHKSRLGIHATSTPRGTNATHFEKIGTAASRKKIAGPGAPGAGRAGRAGRLQGGGASTCCGAGALKSARAVN